MLVQELYKALKQSNEASRKLRSSQAVANNYETFAKKTIIESDLDRTREDENDLLQSQTLASARLTTTFRQQVKPVSENKDIKFFALNEN